jgi:hypothetical protein
MNTNIEHHANAAIYSYPSLYRVRGNPELSRLHVLETLFFTIGTGGEWIKEHGILTDGREPLEQLPEGFFDKELYCFEVEPDKVEGFIAVLGDRFHYTKADRYERDTRIIFEATEREAQEWDYEWDNHRFGRKPKTKPTTEREIDMVFVNAQECTHDIHPYPLCNYSSIVELTVGKTDSCHIENYSFADHPVQPSWIAACVEVAQAALTFYNDPSRYCTDTYSPDQNRGRAGWDYKDAKKKGKEAEHRKQCGYKEGETVEQRLERSFEQHRKSQIKKLEKFLSLHN